MKCYGNISIIITVPCMWVGWDNAFQGVFVCVWGEGGGGGRCIQGNYKGEEVTRDLTVHRQPTHTTYLSISFFKEVKIGEESAAVGGRFPR